MTGFPAAVAETASGAEEPAIAATEADATETFPRLLARKALRHPARPALREKEFGIWREISWARYLESVRELCLGLLSLGLARGDKVAILGDNRPQWVIAELAAQAAGAASVGLYQDAGLSEVAHIIRDSGATFVVAEDQEQVDKILEIIDRMPRVRHLVYWDPRGLRRYAHPALLSFEAVQERGRALHAAQPGRFDEELRRGRPDDVAIICYTSGTTGSPKGAMLSFRNLLTMALSLHAVDPKRETDEFVSFLPLAWIGEQMMSLSSALAVGFAINFPESPETVMGDIREIGPHVMFAPPRIWENLTTSVQVRIMDTTPFKRLLYRLWTPVGHRVAALRFAGKPVPPLLRLLWHVADLALFRALKDRLGLSRLRTCSTGGAALGPDVFRFFHAMGVPLKQIYGQTEVSGISCIHRDGDIRFHTVGVPIPGTSIRISESGEILTRSPSVFLGYHQNEAATRETLRDGWLHSGDAGYLEGDHLVVIDRVKDVMQLADGTQFSPQFIENRLKFSAYVKEAVVIGKDRPFLTAMLCIDLSVVGKWAEKNRLSYTTYTDLSARVQVYDLLEKEVDEVNKTLPRAARLHKFVLLYKELDADDDELTRTRKVRRSFVEERYRDVIAALYGTAREVPIDTTVKFQDGKSARIRTTLQLRPLELEA
jgi:long-chain acyl-CoA synthetase